MGNPAATEKYHAAIGAFISGFSTMELLLKLCIAKMVGVEDQFRLQLFAEVSIGAAIKVLRAVSQIYFTDEVDKKKYDELAVAIHTINDKRNVIAHGTWFATNEGIVAYKAAGKHLKFQPNYPTVKDLHRVMGELSAVQRGLDELFERLLKERSP